MRPLWIEQKTCLVSFLLCWLRLLAEPEVAWCQRTEPAAGPVAQPDCLGEAKCSELYENARRLSQAGQYEAALVSYQSAYAQTTTPWLLVNIGRMQQKAGRPQQAVRTFHRFLDDPAAREDVESQNKAREYLQQAEAEAMAQQQWVDINPPSPKERAPIYKKWRFWATLGGATAAVTIALAVGLAARTPTAAAAAPGVPQGASVYDTGF